MADPQIENLVADTWTLVAAGVTAGVIHIKKPGNYLHTYRVSPSVVPADLSDAISMESNSIAINAASAIDVYMYSSGASGQVRVDL